MLNVSVNEVRLAYNAFRRMNEEIRLQQKPAWRVSRLLGKLKPVVASFEETQLKLYNDAGGIEGGGGIQLTLTPKGENETAESFSARQKEFSAKVSALNNDLRELGEESVDVDYDPLPWSMFDDAPNASEDKKLKYNPNDLADAGPFLIE